MHARLSASQVVVVTEGGCEVLSGHDVSLQDTT
jgi:hypothetical protein